jgi:hypothetical protein
MPAMTRTLSRLLLAIAIVACSAPPAVDDAGNDADVDAGHDAAPRPDVGHDAPPRPDAGPLPTCATSDALALGQCIDRARYETDLAEIAMPREPSSAHWQAVQDLCADRLAMLGFTVERHTYATGVNVIGVRDGATDPTHRVLVGAHYDHIPGCAGADDNATGVAGALEVARVLAMASFDRTLVVACWDEEERGLVGSRAYAARAVAIGEIIDDYFNFEMIGYRNTAPNSQRLPLGIDLVFRDANAEYIANDRRADFVAVIGDPLSNDAVTSLETYADRIGLPFIPLRVPDSLLQSAAAGDLRRSDHAAFWDQMYPGILITDTSEFRYDAYHCTGGPDVVENLDAAFTTQILQMTTSAAASSLGL